MLPFGEHLDQIQIQNSATHVEGRAGTAPVVEKLGGRAPNAVVMEKSSHNDANVNAQRIAALRTVTEQLGHVVVDATVTSVSQTAQQCVIVKIGPHAAQTTKHEPGARLPESYVVTAGSARFDQLVPRYAGVAFAF